MVLEPLTLPAFQTKLKRGNTTWLLNHRIFAGLKWLKCGQMQNLFKLRISTRTSRFLSKFYKRKSGSKVTRNVEDWVESFYNYFQPLHDVMIDNFDVFVYRNPNIFPRAHAKLELLRIQITTFRTKSFLLIHFQDTTSILLKYTNDRKYRARF